MQYNQDRTKVSDIQIAYIGGGSRGWAWNIMRDFALEEDISGQIKLYDIDHQAARNNEKIGNNLFARDDVPGDWNFTAVETLQDALVAADFVIISILPGTFKEMESDVHAPEKYGIYQAVGDSVGPGGLVRALRTIPMYVEFASAIKEYCPEAWVINYTNPMSLCVRTLYEIFPQIKAFGCCHEVFGTQSLLGDALAEIKDIKDAKRDDIRVNVLGINHFTWLDSAFYKGIDLFPVYQEFVDKYYESGYGEYNPDNYFSGTHRVKFDLFKRYGLIAAAGDRHLAEFVPGKWYLKDPDTVKKWGFNLTPVKWRIKDKKNKLARAKRLKNGEEKITLKKSGEEGIRQIKAILGLGDFVTNVNIPNTGQMKDIPSGAIVETNAFFSSDNVRPLVAGRLPDDVLDLVIRHVLNQETTLQAALNQDKKLAFNAFANDPLVNIDLEDASNLFTTMLENTSEYLPDWNL